MTAWLAVTTRPDSGSSTLGSASYGTYSPVQSFSDRQPAAGSSPSLPDLRIGTRPVAW